MIFLDSLNFLNVSRVLYTVFYCKSFRISNIGDIDKDDINKFIQKRGFPALVFRDIMATNPLSVAIPKEYGGRGVKPTSISVIANMDGEIEPRVRRESRVTPPRAFVVIGSKPSGIVDFWMI